MQDGRSRVLVVTGEPGDRQEPGRRRARRARCRRAGSWSAGASRSGARPLLSAMAQAVASARSGIEPGRRRRQHGGHRRGRAPGGAGDTPSALRRPARTGRVGRRGAAQRPGRGPRGPAGAGGPGPRRPGRRRARRPAVGGPGPGGPARRRAPQPWPAPVLVLGLSRARVRGLPAARCPGWTPTRCARSRRSCWAAVGSAEAAGVPVSRANGNALFLEEMLEMLVGSGALREQDGSWQVVDRGVAGDVPQTIRLLIAARLDTLPADQKELLQDASVCGTTTWDALLAQVSDVAERRVALRALVARGLLRKNPTSAVADSDEYEWKHALIRDVAYGSLPKAVRAERHAQIAAWFRATARAGRRAGRVHRLALRAGLGAVGLEDRSGTGPEVVRLAAEYLTRWAEQTFVWQARAAEPLFRRAVLVIEAAGDARTSACRPRIARAGRGPDRDGPARRGDRAGDPSAAAGGARRRRGPHRARAARARAVGERRRAPGPARSLLEGARTASRSSVTCAGRAGPLHRLSETWASPTWTARWPTCGRLPPCSPTPATASAARWSPTTSRTSSRSTAAVSSTTWYEQARRLVEDDGDLRSRASLLRTWGTTATPPGASPRRSAPRSRAGPSPPRRATATPSPTRC